MSVHKPKCLLWEPLLASSFCFCVTTFVRLLYCVVDSPRSLLWRCYHVICWLLSAVGVVCILIGHEHYSVDVVVAYFITSRLFYWYHTMANNQVKACVNYRSYKSNIQIPLTLLTWEDAVDWIWGFPACKTMNCWDAQFCWQLMINNHLSWFNVPSKLFLEMFLEQQISC